MITPDPSGWVVAVTHPTSGRIKTPDVLDLQDAPALNPGPNAQPRLRIPVRKDDVWLSSAYDDDPEMRVWKDGRRFPIEVLRDVEQRENATVLVGVGGVELEQRVSEEFNDDRRHIAAGDLVTTNTTYAVDAPAPDVPTLKNQSQEVVDTEAEWVAALANENEDTDLWGVTSGGVLRRRQTAYFEEADGDNTIRGSRNIEPEEEYNYIGQDIYFFDDSVTNNVEAGISVTLDLDYTIPAGEVRIAWRGMHPADDGGGGAYHQEYTHRVNGDAFDTIPADVRGFQDVPRWFTAGGASADATAGSTTVEVRMTGDSAEPDQQEIAIDAIMIYDARHPPNLIDEVTEPERKAQVDFYNGSSVVETSDVQTAFSIAGGRLEADVNDTTNNQSVGLSNDGGETWTDAANTDTIETAFADVTSRLRARFELGGYDGEISNAIGQLNGQEVDLYELFADIDQELLLIEETFDNDLASVLTSMAEPAERSWRFGFEDGTPTVRFVQNGQFEADFTPEFEDRTREKLGKTYDSVTILGSNEPAGNVPYTASTTFESLPDVNILSGSETVYDDAKNYERGTDYEIRYRDGEIRATSGGDLTVGNDYRIDYRFQAQGTFENPNAPADPDELVETVPGVTSTRLAEQVAFVIASDVDTPRYAAEVTIPNPDPRFDPTDALPPESLGLPVSLSPMEVRGEPQLTPRGLRVRLGTRPSTEQNLSRLTRQVSRVTDRS